MRYGIKTHRYHGLAIVGLVATTILLSGCGTTYSTAVNRGTKGMIPLTSIKVGIPESVVQEGILSFVPDDKGAVDNKSQYLSRTSDSNGGQYIVQARDGYCYGVQVVHVNPIAKETALATLKKLLPDQAPPQVSSKEDQSYEGPVEKFFYGDSYVGELVYSDKNKTAIRSVNAWIKKGGAVELSQKAASGTN